MFTLFLKSKFIIQFDELILNLGEFSLNFDAHGPDIQTSKTRRDLSPLLLGLPECDRCRFAGFCSHLYSSDGRMPPGGFGNTLPIFELKSMSNIVGIMNLVISFS